MGRDSSRFRAGEVVQGLRVLDNRGSKAVVLTLQRLVVEALACADKERWGSGHRPTCSLLHAAELPVLCSLHGVMPAHCSPHKSALRREP